MGTFGVSGGLPWGNRPFVCRRGRLIRLIPYAGVLLISWCGGKSGELFVSWLVGLGSFVGVGVKICVHRADRQIQQEALSKKLK